MEIDNFDLRILALLQEEANVDVKKLAKAVNLPADECNQRKKALENSGLIGGYHAFIDRQKAGFDIFAFIAVNLVDTDRKNAEKFASFVKLLPQVLEVHALTEDMDFLVKIVAQNLEDISHIVNEQIANHNAVKNVKTLVSLETIKETTALPI